MAHEYVMNYLSSPSCENTTVSNIIAVAWEYADAMQAEADKRVVSGLPEALQDDFEVDWCVAPGWAKYWAVDKYGDAYWFEKAPKLGSFRWLSQFGELVNSAPSFNYKGDWKESLRTKP